METPGVQDSLKIAKGVYDDLFQAGYFEGSDVDFDSFYNRITTDTTVTRGVFEDLYNAGYFDDGEQKPDYRTTFGRFFGDIAPETYKLIQEQERGAATPGEQELFERTRHYPSRSVDTTVTSVTVDPMATTESAQGEAEKVIKGIGAGLGIGFGSVMEGAYNQVRRIANAGNAEAKTLIDLDAIEFQKRLQQEAVNFGADPEHWSTKAGGAIGSAFPFVLAGFLTGGLPMVLGASGAAATVIGGASVGTLGALSSADAFRTDAALSQLQDAGETVSPEAVLLAGADARDSAGFIGALVGASEAIPIGRLLPGRYAAVKVAEAYLKKHLVAKLATQAVEEGAQEAFATVAQNITAMSLYDKERGAFEGAGESFLYGALAGATVNSLLTIGANLESENTVSKNNALEMQEMSAANRNVEAVQNGTASAYSDADGNISIVSDEEAQAAGYRPVTAEEIRASAGIEEKTEEPGGPIERVIAQPKNVSELRVAMMSVFNLNPDEAVAVADVYDSVARGWARRNGKKVEDWYEQKLHSFQKLASAEEVTIVLAEASGAAKLQNVVKLATDAQAIANEGLAETELPDNFSQQNITLSATGQPGVFERDGSGVYRPAGRIEPARVADGSQKPVFLKLGRVLRAADGVDFLSIDSLVNAVLSSRYTPEQVKTAIAEVAKTAPSTDRIYAVLQDFGYEAIATGGVADKANYRVLNETASVTNALTKKEAGQTGYVAGREFKYGEQGAMQTYATDGGVGVQGMARRLADGRSIIYATTDADVSTPLHELAHIFEYDLTAEQRKAVMTWLGTDKWDVDTSEMFARGFEKYLSEGAAPNKAMKPIFEMFKDWLKSIYSGVVSYNGRTVELNSAMRSVYRQIVAHDAAAKQSVRYDFATRRFVNADSGTLAELSPQEQVRVFARSAWQDFFARFPKMNPTDARVSDMAKETNSPLFIATTIARMEADPVYNYAVAEQTIGEGVVMDRSKMHYAGRLVELIRANRDILRGVLESRLTETAKPMLDANFKWLGTQSKENLEERKSALQKSFVELTGNTSDNALADFLLAKHADLAKLTKYTGKNGEFDLVQSMNDWAVGTAKALFQKTTGFKYTKSLMKEIADAEPESRVLQEVMPKEDGVRVDAEGRIVSIEDVPVRFQMRPMPIRFQTKTGSFQQGSLSDLGVRSIMTNAKTLIANGFPKTGTPAQYIKAIQTAVAKGFVRGDVVKESGIELALEQLPEKNTPMTIDELVEFFAKVDPSNNYVVTIIEGNDLSEAGFIAGVKERAVELIDELAKDGVVIGHADIVESLDTLINGSQASENARALAASEMRQIDESGQDDEKRELVKEYVENIANVGDSSYFAELIMNGLAYADGQEPFLLANSARQASEKISAGFAKVSRSKKFEDIGKRVLDTSVIDDFGGGRLRYNGNLVYFTHNKRPYVLAMVYDNVSDVSVLDSNPSNDSPWKLVDSENPYAKANLQQSTVPVLLAINNNTEYGPPITYSVVREKDAGIPGSVYEKLVQFAYANRAIRGAMEWSNVQGLHGRFDEKLVTKGPNTKKVSILLRRKDQRDGLYFKRLHYPYVDIQSHIRGYDLGNGVLRIIESQSDLSIAESKGEISGNIKGLLKNATLAKLHAAVISSFAVRNGFQKIEVPTSSTLYSARSDGGISESAAKNYDLLAKEVARLFSEKYRAIDERMVADFNAKQPNLPMAKASFATELTEEQLDDQMAGVWRIELKANKTAVGQVLQFVAEQTGSEIQTSSPGVKISGNGTMISVPSNIAPDGAPIRFQSKMRPANSAATIPLSGRLQNPKGASSYDRFMAHWFKSGQELSLLNDEARNFNALQRDDKRRGRINMHVHRAKEHANALTKALELHFGMSMLDKLKAHMGIAKPAYARVDPGVAAANTTTVDQFAAGFTRWLKGQRREIMDKLLNTTPATPAVVFDSRFLHAYNLFASGRRFTPEVEEIFESFTDQYAESMQDKSLLEALNDVLLHKRSIDTIPQSLRAPVAAMRAHMDELTQDMISFGVVTADFAAVISDRMGVYMTRSFKIFAEKNYAKRINPETYDAAVNYVFNELLQKDPNAVVADAIRIVEELIEEKDIEGAATMLYSKGAIGQKDLSVLRKRGDIPKPIRALLGEYLDPQTNYMHTVAKVAGLVSNHRFLQELKDGAKGELFFDATDKDRPANASVKIENPALAPLAGMYTYPDVVAALNQATQKNRVNSRFIRALLALNAFVKLNKTIFNPVTHVRNPMGGGIMAMASGNFSAANLAKAISILRSKPGDPEYALRELALEQNVIGDDVHVEEVRQYVEEFQNVVDEDSFANAGVRATAMLLQKPAQYAAKAYQFEDESMKLMIWLTEARALENYYGMSTSDAMEEAGKRVHDLYPSHSRSVGIVKSLRRNPLVASFATFAGESVRVQKNMLKLAGKELANPDMKIKARGVERLLGMMVVHGGIAAVSAVSGAMLFGGDDENEKDARRNLPPWSANNEILWLESKDGVIKYIDMSFNDPFSTWKKPFNLLLNKDRDRTIGQYAKDAVWKLFEPFLAPEIFVQAIAESIANSRFSYGGSVVSETDPMYEAKLIGHILKEFVPGFVNDISAMNRAVQGLPENFYGRVPTVGDELMEKVGMKQSTINLRIPLSVKTRRNLRLLQDVSGSWNASMLDQRNLRNSEFDANKVYDEHNERYRKVQDEIMRDVASVRALGVSFWEAQQVLMAAGMKPKQAEELIVGYRAPLPRNYGKIVEKQVRNRMLYSDDGE